MSVSRVKRQETRYTTGEDRMNTPPKAAPVHAVREANVRDAARVSQRRDIAKRKITRGATTDEYPVL